MTTQPTVPTIQAVESPISRVRRRLIVVSFLLTYIAGAAFVAYRFLMHQSIRLDESQSLWQTSHSFGYMLRVVASDVHVPLYHMILHFWQLYFGHGIVTVRLLSLIFFLMTIPLMYLLSREVLRTRWALFATFLFSFMPFTSWYSSETRMYTLLVFCAVLSQYLFIRIIKRKKVWVRYGIVAAIGAYAHYFFSFNLATQGLFYLLNYKQFPRRTLWRFIGVAATVGIALSPWLIYFFSLGAAKDMAPHLTRPSTVDFFNAFSQFFFGFQNDAVNTILVSCWPLVVLIAFFAMKRGQKLSLEIGYLAFAAFMPVFLAYVLSFVVNPFFLSRYMSSCVPPLVILLVWLISHYGRRLSAIASVGIVAVLFFSLVQQIHSAQTPVKEDYQAVAAMIAKEGQAQDVVALSAPFTVYPFEYYYNGRAKVSTLPLWNRQSHGAIPPFSAQRLPQEVKQITANHQRLYLVLSQDQGYEDTIRQYFLGHYKQLSKRTYSPGLTVYVFQVGYNTVPGLGAPETLINAPE